MKQSLLDIDATLTSHNVGKKRILLSSKMSECPITQIAVTDFHSGEVAEAHVHADMQEGFLCHERTIRYSARCYY